MLCVSNPYNSYAKVNPKKTQFDNHKRIIIVPPIEKYTIGYQNGLDQEECFKDKKKKNNKCRMYLACEENGKNPTKSLLSSLGKRIHIAMEQSLGKFNNEREAKQKGLFYIKQTKVSPCCKDNYNISKFYDSIKNQGFLSKQLSKNNCDVIVWTEYDINYHKTIEKHIDDPEKKECEIQVKVCFYDGYSLKTKPVKLIYNDNFRSFSNESTKDISEIICELLKQKHLFQNTKSKRISNN